MNATLLVLHRYADRFKHGLAQEFPDIAILAATTREAAIPLAGRAQVIVALDSQFDDDLVGAATDLRWIQALSTGTDVIDGLRALDRLRVVVTTMRGIHGPQMCEIACMHMLALSRGLPKMLRNQQDHRWERWEQPLLWHKTAVILGVGAIAEDMARCFNAFGMTVVGISRTEREVAHFDRIYPRSRMNEAVALADYFVVLAPHSKENDRMVNAGVLAAMKPGAYLVNVSRGGVVDEEALIDALRRGAIAGAGLDVFSSEPLPQDHPFWSLENVIITPRVGGMSNVYVEQCLPLLRRNLRAFVAGNTAGMINRVRPGD
jgi:phosphoglycerate dehydrogenase-like enzyme